RGSGLTGPRSARVQGPVWVALEPGEQPAGAERIADVGGEHPHVRALAAEHVDLGLGDLARSEVEEPRLEDRHLARPALDLHALAGELVEVAAVVTHRGVHRRD